MNHMTKIENEMQYQVKRVADYDEEHLGCVITSVYNEFTLAADICSKGKSLRPLIFSEVEVVCFGGGDVESAHA